jgi:hypothetical protein
VVLGYVIAGGKFRNQISVQISVGMVLNIFNASSLLGETSLFHKPP